MAVGVYGPYTTVVFFGFVTPFYVSVRFAFLGPWLTTGTVLALLGAIHYDSILTNTSMDRMSYTGTLMMMAAKVSMFGFHFDDGRKLASGIQLAAHPHVNDQRKLTAIQPEQVSFFKYLCYMFEFMGGIVGPLFNYSEYIDFVYSRRDYSALSSAPLIVPSLKAILRACVLLSLFLFISKYEWLSINSLVSSWFMKLPFFQRILVSPVIAVCSRLPFYAVWTLSEVSCTISGISFQQPHRFPRGRNINILEFEFGTNSNQLTNNWNIRIAELWLKGCVYQRIEAVPERLRHIVGNRKVFANLTTKLTSAIWHGWYSGYTISFLSLGLCNWSETLVRRKIQPLLPSKLLQSRFCSVLAWVHTWMSINVFFAPFLLLTWDRITTYLNSVYWFMYIYHFAIIAAASVIKTPTAKKHM